MALKLISAGEPGLDKLVRYAVVSLTIKWTFQDEERTLGTSGVEFVDDGRKSTGCAKEGYP